MAELGGTARAVVGKSSVSGALDVKVTTVLLGVAIVMAALVISWAAEGVTPRRLWWVNKITEAEGPSQDFQDHLARAEELLVAPVFVPAVYPGRTAPGITTTMHQGFRTATWQTTDPDIEARGRTEPW